MKTIVKAILIYLLLQQNHAIAQIKELKMGDQCPDFHFGNIYNYSKKQFNLYDFKGKWVILDFWATYCTPCIAAFPKLDSLQKEFANDLMIIPVNSGENKLFDSYFKKLPVYSKVNLPFVVHDTLLKNYYFKHKVIPHEVWIDRDGVVRAITDDVAVTRKNIQQAISGVKLAWPVKRDFVDFNPYKPLAWNLTEDSSLGMIQYSSTITKRIRSVGSVDRFYNGDTYQTILLVNSSITDMFKVAFAEGDEAFQRNRVVLEVKDSSVFYWNGMDESLARDTNWQNKAMFNYELNVSNDLISQKYKIMQRDLNSYFGSLYGINAHKEKRKIKYLSLQYRPGEYKLTPSKGGVTTRYAQSDSKGIHIRNAPLDQLLRELNIFYWYKLPTPIINETGYQQNIDLDMKPINWFDVNEVKKEFSKYGLELVEKEKEVDMLIIRDRQ